VRSLAGRAAVDAVKSAPTHRGEEEPMERAKLLTMFRNMATEIAEKDFSHVAEESVIAELGIDSLGMLELVGAMERDLGVQVPDDELVGIQTVKQLLDLVEKRATV
jgi:acyl carrier protein